MCTLHRSNYIITLLKGLGIKTGVDLNKLIEVGAYISGILGRQTASKVALATGTTLKWPIV